MLLDKLPKKINKRQEEGIETPSFQSDDSEFEEMEEDLKKRLAKL